MVLRAGAEKEARTADIKKLSSVHGNLAESEAVTEVKANGGKLGQLAEGQGEIKGGLNTLLAFIKPVAAEEAFAKSADEPVGAQPSR